MIDQECEDEVSAQRNKDHLKKEIGRKARCCEGTHQTNLKTRRNMIMGSTRPEEIISEYPHLRKAKYVCVCYLCSLISERAKRASSVMFVFNRDFRYVYIIIYVAVRQPLRACPDIIAKKCP